MPRFLQIGLGITAALGVFYLAAKYFIPELVEVLSAVVKILIPFMIALLLAMFLEPLVRLFMNRGRMSRASAAGLSMLLVFGGIGIILWLLINRLVVELIDLSQSLPHYQKPVQDFIARAVEQGRYFIFQYPDINQRIQENLGSITDRVSGFAGSLANFLLHFATAVPGAVLGIIVTLIATYFFIRDRRLIVNLWLKIMPAPWGGRVLEISREVAGAFLAYVRAQAVLISLSTIQAIVGLYIIGAEYALTVGLLVGLFDMIPVLGPATIIIPWAAWSIISGSTALGIKLIVLYLFIWLVRQSLEAKVVAANLGLHPLAVLAAMYIGLKTLGVLGLIIGPIMLIAVQAAMKAVGWRRTV